MNLHAPRLLVLVSSLVPASAFAHPGHGTTEPDGWLHYLTEPVHVAMVLGAIVAVGWVGYRRRRTSDRRLERRPPQA